MADHKKQHYVPKFYLKSFSKHDKKKTINLINIESGRTIENVSIANQCYEDYFYGNDLKIEKALGLIETRVAMLFSEIIDQKKLPEYLSSTHFEICIYIILQHTRTLMAKIEMEDSLRKILNHIVETHIKYKYPEEDIKNIKNSFSINFNNTPKLIIKSTFPIHLLLSNLKTHLVVNATHKEFITSDNPVFTYNSYLVKNKSIDSSGLSYSGLQIFIPLAGSVLLCLYDDKIYKYGSKNGTITYIDEASDVDMFNKIQFINCLHNVYCGEKFSVSEFTKHLALRKTYKSRNKFIINEEEINNDSIQQLIETIKKDVDINFETSFIKIRSKPKKVPIKERKLELRDAELTMHVTKFTEQIRKGKYNILEFTKYLKDLNNAVSNYHWLSS